MPKIGLIILALLILPGVLVFSQTTNNPKSLCESYFDRTYIFDGQDYKTVLKSSNKITYKCIFFSGMTYRIGVATSLKNGNLIFSVYDNHKNLIFTNKNAHYTAFWNFKILETIECLVEITADYADYKNGIIYMLIGFKK